MSCLKNNGWFTPPGGPPGGVSHPKETKMKLILTILLFICAQSIYAQHDYLAGIKTDLQKKWPGNRIINLVFHGHSVPAGYFKTPDVRTMEAYPQQVLQTLKKNYPLASINVITTAIGGENSTQGLKRFKKTVLNHRP